MNAAEPLKTFPSNTTFIMEIHNIALACPRFSGKGSPHIIDHILYRLCVPAH